MTALLVPNSARPTNSRSLQIVATGALALFVAACSGDAPDDGNQSDAADAPAPDASDVSDAVDTTDERDDDARPSIPDPELVASVCTAQATWRCEVAAQCSCPDDVAGAQCLEGALSECLARVAAQVERSTQPMRINADGAQSCIAAWSTATIDCGPMQFARFDAACAAVVVADVNVGDACSEELLPCASGDGLCSGGLCNALPAIGEPCDDAEGAGAVCAAEASCIGGVPAESAPVDLGGECSSSEQCVAGGRCLAGQCVASGGVGELCDEARPCRGALLCESGACVPGDAEQCVAPGPNAGCGEEALCGAARASSCEQPGPLGSACNDTAQCAGDAFCNTTTLACETRPGLGEACGDGLWCSDGLACSFEDATCIPIPQRGEACALGLFGPFTCAEGLACVARLCDDPPGEGEPCAGNTICAAGLGCAFEGTESLCRTKRSAGESCDNDSICETGTHCNFAAQECRTNFEAGAGCAQGNECGPDGSCMPTDDGTFACGAMPGEGDACFLECGDGLACVTRLDSYACFPSICALNW
jgi:hypothetical protein